tara:strand:- start:630 stop:839 length:210 start_codon:yes stop_codon:yes gene_type:complete
MSKKLLGIEYISKELFFDFVECQKSGICNMFSPEVREHVFMTEDEHFTIIRNYDRIAEKYPEVLEMLNG